MPKTFATTKTDTSALAPKASPAFTGTPTAPTAGAGISTTQVATTEFVQVAVRSTPGKEASEYATIAALPTVVYDNGASGVGATLTGVALGALGVDSQSPAVGNRILVKNQVSTFQNGIYTVTATGSGVAVFVMTRALDFNQQTDILTGAATYVVGGTTLAGTTWDVNSADSPVIGTDAITFVQSAGPGSVVQGNGITITGTSIAINTAVTADLSSTQTLTNKTIDGVTPTIMGYVDPTSSIQTQINTKATGTLPVKASSAEVDTGTDDAKFATALAISGSHNVPHIVPGTSGNVLRSNGTDWTASASAALADAVTTNANLTGDVTSSGNATTIAWTRNPYCFGAVPAAATTLVDGAHTKITYGTEIYDYNSNFATSTYTVPVAGVYHFDATFTIGTIATPVLMGIELYVNGAINQWGTRAIGDTNMVFLLSQDILLAANDTVEIYGYQDSAGNEDTLYTTGRSFFSGHLVHRTA